MDEKAGPGMSIMPVRINWNGVGSCRIRFILRHSVIYAPHARWNRPLVPFVFHGRVISKFTLVTTIAPFRGKISIRIAQLPCPLVIEPVPLSVSHGHGRLLRAGRGLSRLAGAVKETLRPSLYLSGRTFGKNKGLSVSLTHPAPLARDSLCAALRPFEIYNDFSLKKMAPALDNDLRKGILYLKGHLGGILARLCLWSMMV